MSETADPGKCAAAYAAVDKYVQSGMCIGLGTGTTAYWAIERCGQRVAAGEKISAVATSNETAQLCHRFGIPVVDLPEAPLPVAIDGADEVAPDRSLTKGGGGALFREKAVALSAQRFIVIVTEVKLVPALGRFPLPVELVPFAAPYVHREIAQRFGDIELNRREIDGRPFVTDNSNSIFDLHFGQINDVKNVDRNLRAIHGVVCTGLFYDVVSEVLVGNADGAVRSL